LLRPRVALEQCLPGNVRFNKIIEIKDASASREALHGADHQNEKTLGLIADLINQSETSKDPNYLPAPSPPTDGALGDQHLRDSRTTKDHFPLSDDVTKTIPPVWTPATSAHRSHALHQFGD